MAKGKVRYIRRTAKKVYRRGKSGGGMKPIIDGLIAGAGSQIAGKYLGAWGRPVAVLGVGYYMKNSTLKTIGGMEIGAMLGSMFTGGNGIGGIGGGGSQV